MFPINKETASLDEVTSWEIRPGSPPRKKWPHDDTTIWPAGLLLCVEAPCGIPVYDEHGEYGSEVLETGTYFKVYEVKTTGHPEICLGLLEDGLWLDIGPDYATEPAGKPPPGANTRGDLGLSAPSPRASSEEEKEKVGGEKKKKVKKKAGRSAVEKLGSGRSRWIGSPLETQADKHPRMEQVIKEQRAAEGEKESPEPDSPAKTAKKNLKEKKGDENGFRAAGGENGSPEPDSPDVWNKSPEEERLSLSAFVEALKFVEAQWEAQRRTNPSWRHCIYCGVYEPFAQDGTDLSCRNKDCVFID